MHRPAFSANSFGIASALIATVFFSFNDMMIKFLSGDYALHQVVLIRSLIGLVLLFVLILPFEGGMQSLRTKRLGAHLLRGFLIVIANLSFFMALAALPLADVTAIFFISPMVITVFSVIFLREHVGVHRWIAVAAGMVGVVIMIRPGLGSFHPAALLPLLAATAYAGTNILTRKIGGTERAATMTFYIQITFVVVTAVSGLAFGDGRFAGSGDPSIEFLLRAWIWPDLGDIWVFLLIGFASTMGGYFISQAYRLCEAGLAAPFEYVTMVFAVFWGFVVFGDLPDLIAWAGIVLIVGGGLFMLWRESIHSRIAKKRLPRRMG